MKPRIYTYKITFEEVPYWYWGVHKERKFGELYLGSPKTHAWAWKFYTPKIQILEFFPSTPEGWIQAQLVEDRLILPDLNNPLCLNESCGFTRSLATCSKAGKKGAETTMKEKDEKGRSINSMKGALTAMRKGVGLTARSLEKMREDGRKAGKVSGRNHARNKTGICGRSLEQKQEDGRKGGKIAGRNRAQDKTGICGLTKEQLSHQGLKTTSQIWESTVDGFRSNAANVVKHNKSLGYDPSARVRIA